MAKNRLILEFTEFNLQRLNADSVQPSVHVDNPSLSTNAFDKHEDKIRQAMSRINDILYNLKGTTSYSKLKGHLSISEQDVKGIKIQRIIGNENSNYDVYLTILIKDKEYWGKISNITSDHPKLESEIFKDTDLYITKEWTIKTKGVIIKTIKEWLKPKPGIYSCLKDKVYCYNLNTGEIMVIEEGTDIELIKSYNDKIIINHRNTKYSIINDNYIFFNWWFEKK